jgi:hypothetical protein
MGLRTVASIWRYDTATIILFTLRASAAKLTNLGRCIYVQDGCSEGAMDVSPEVIQIDLHVSGGGHTHVKSA